MATAGNGLILRCTFRDATGAAVDATGTVTCTITSPAGEATVLETTHTAPGTYEASYMAPERWSFFDWEFRAEVEGAPEVGRRREYVSRLSPV